MIPVRLTKAAPKRSKYGNVKTDGFDSKHEAKVYTDLKLLEKLGEVRGLRRQVPYEIQVGGQTICKYVADFVFQEAPCWETVVADAKSAATRKNRAYRIKAKLMAALYQPVREL